jgi:hypothetical protein
MAPDKRPSGEAPNNMADKRPSGESPNYMTLQRHGAIRRKSSPLLPDHERLERRERRRARRGSGASSSSGRSELTGDRAEDMVAKNARDINRAQELIGQAAKFPYESKEAKSLYEHATRLGAAVRERQALIGCITDGNQPSQNVAFSPEVAEGERDRLNRRARIRSQERNGQTQLKQ